MYKNLLKKTLFSIIGGIFIALLTIAPAMAFLDFLIPGGFHATFDDFIYRWALVCIVLVFIFYEKISKA